ncbi:hypothetical protein P12x_001331 [Tundrisphaera lichenicola]|uniref:hypothetical protein n=1 Tax=Tundrisphaera lichenicola TaxID=2029860 RepID=UPI003EBB2B5F
MSLAKHRWAAVSILATGVVILVSWGRSQAHETAEIREYRDQFDGQWVATRIQSGENLKAEGPEVSHCRIEFRGKSVVFRQMIGGIDTQGTYFIQPTRRAGKIETGRGIDLRLDAGWAIGVFEIEPNELSFSLNPLALPERLGVPTRRRPTHVRAGEGHDLYVFRRAMPGE